MSRKDTFRTTCTITRNPAVGESGITTIATDLPCMPPTPSVSGLGGNVNWDHATQYDKHFTYIDFIDGIEQEDILTCDGITYTISRIARWPLLDGPVLQITLEART